MRVVDINMNLTFELKRKALQLLVDCGFYISRTSDPLTVLKIIKELAPRLSYKPLIRLGGSGDGGYLAPDDFDGVQACFSPGVSVIANFELEMASRGIPSYMADYSVDGPPVLHESFDFEKKFLGVTNDDVFITLKDWVQRKAPGNGDLVLQMDIEGAEYAVLLDTPDEILCRFRMMVIEFHGLDRLASAANIDFFASIFNRLSKYFNVVHIHPNNCSSVLRLSDIEIPTVMEFTFIRKDRSACMGYANNFPHSLDEKNLSHLPDVVLPVCWQGVNQPDI